LEAASGFEDRPHPGATKAMSYSISILPTPNLHDVFGENHPRVVARPSTRPGMKMGGTKLEKWLGKKANESRISSSPPPAINVPPSRLACASLLASTLSLCDDSSGCLLLAREVGDRCARVIVSIGNVDTMVRVDRDLEEVCEAAIGAAG
jgi:hypothetical protein